MIRKFLRLGVCWALLSAASCEWHHGTTAPDYGFFFPKHGSVSLTLDGVSVFATEIAVFTGPDLYGIQLKLENGLNVSLVFPHPVAVGTPCPLGNQSPYVATVGTSDLLASWSTLYEGGGGTFTFSAFSNGHAAGTFAFTAVNPQALNVETAKTHLAAGTFDVRR